MSRLRESKNVSLHAYTFKALKLSRDERLHLRLSPFVQSSSLSLNPICEQDLNKEDYTSQVSQLACVPSKSASHTGPLGAKSRLMKQVFRVPALAVMRCYERIFRAPTYTQRALTLSIRDDLPRILPAGSRRP